MSFITDLLDSSKAKIQSELSIVEKAIDDITQETIGLDIEQLLRLNDPEEDALDKTRLVTVEQVYRAIYEMRDEILTNEIPTWGSYVMGGLLRTIGNVTETAFAVLEGIRERSVAPVVGPLIQLLSRYSPRGLIIRMDTVRWEQEKRLRKLALPQPQVIRRRRVVARRV